MIVGRINRSIFTKLAITQLLSLIVVVLDLLVIAFFYRWRTESYFESIGDYAASFNVAVPPLALAAFTYILAILTGMAVQDVPKTVIAFLRNKFFQSYPWMGCFLLLSVLWSGYGFYKITQEPPPHYENFVAKLLGGASDNHQAVRKILSQIQEINPALASEYSSVVDVFEERQKQNTSERSAARANVLVRILETNIDADWREHPLRRLGLAEAYVLAAQAVLSDQDGAQAIVDGEYDKAIEVYRTVVSSASPLATDLLRASALNNIGNIYYYRSDLDQAEETYRNLVEDEDLRNTAAWGNLIATLVRKGDVHAAIEQGLTAKGWAEANGKAFSEPYQYAAILENTALAYWEADDYATAHPFLEAASAFRDDPLNRENVAISFALLGQLDDAARNMRRVSEPALPENASDLARRRLGDNCEYLVWAAVISPTKLAERAANLSVFLQEPWSRDALVSTTPETYLAMASQALTRLETLQAPCSSLAQLAGFRALLSPTPQ